MPMHDWTRVEAGIYHDFHLEWISRIKASLNSRLPCDYYALAEQFAAGFGPDVLTLQFADPDNSPVEGGTVTLQRPKTKLFQETGPEFYQSKQSSLSIRHASGDRVVAMIEIVSPGNKNTVHGFKAFVRKVRELLQKRIHFLIVDPFPAGSRDPDGLHAAIFEEFEDHPLKLPASAPLSLIAYECGDTLRSYIEPYAVGDKLAEMPIYLYPEMYVKVPLEEAYMSAWEAVPKRWQQVITPTS